MHTNSYSRVIAKFKLVGREYMDGFSANDFIGLSPAERDEIKGMLIERAGRGDGVALSGLGEMIPEDEYLQFIVKLLANQDSRPSFCAKLLTEICRIQGGDDIWFRMLDCLGGGDPFAKSWILGEIRKLSIPPNMNSRLKMILHSVIKNDRVKHNLIMASGELLDIYGIKPGTEIYMSLAKRMFSQDPLVREHALTELEGISQE